MIITTKQIIFSRINSDRFNDSVHLFQTNFHIRTKNTAANGELLSAEALIESDFIGSGRFVFDLSMCENNEIIRNECITKRQ